MSLLLIYRYICFVTVKRLAVTSLRKSLVNSYTLKHTRNMKKFIASLFLPAERKYKNIKLAIVDEKTGKEGTTQRLIVKIEVESIE